MKKIVIITLIVSLFGLGTYLFYKEGTLAVNKKDATFKTFVVEKGATLDAIINKLASEGLIRNRLSFYWVVKQKGIERSIQAGSFRLSPSLDAYQIADALTKGKEDTWITIPEGLRKEEVAEIVAKELDISTAEFISAAQEGYLFPETYSVPKTATVQEVTDLMKKTLAEKYDAKMRANAKKLGLNDQQVIILASLLEREALFDDDRQEIASILVRRFKEEYPLQVDATVQYVLGYQPDEKRWWKRSLTYDDLKIESLYNTYAVTGLPPTPISSPGIASIMAITEANPDTPYFFYLHDAQGKTYYAKTFEDHQKNIKKYLK